MSGEKTYNKITVVDEHDNVIGAEDMLEAIAKGLTRSAVRIFVFSESGKVLLQKRSSQVRHPNKLNMSADGHVDEGETREVAALRELAEEIGIVGYPLTTVASSFVSPGTINGVYKTVVPETIALNFDTEEVSELKWVSVAELEASLLSEPEIYTSAFMDTWTQLKDKLIID